MTTPTDTDMAQALRELFETWLEIRPPFRTTVEVEAAWEGWKANTAVAAMLTAHESRAQQKTASGLKQADAQQVVHHELETKGPDQSSAQPAGVGEYTTEMGNAAEKYYASFKYAHPLPARWSWLDLWQAMLAAAPQTPAKDAEHDH